MNDGFFSHLPGYCQATYGFTHNLTHQQWAACLRLSAAQAAHGISGPGLAVGLGVITVGWLLARSAYRRLRRRRAQ
jgi:hypothetical protein